MNGSRLSIDCLQSRLEKMTKSELTKREIIFSFCKARQNVKQGIVPICNKISLRAVVSVSDILKAYDA